MGQTLTIRELLTEMGQHIMDKYLLGGTVLAVEVSPDQADTCVIGESHEGTSHHLCLKKVDLEDTIDADRQNVLQISKATWEKSLEQNFLKAKLDEWKAEQAGS